MGGGGQGLKESHLHTCLSNTAQASTWQFWEFLVLDGYCLKKQSQIYSNSCLTDRKVDDRGECSMTRRHSQEAAGGALKQEGVLWS